MWDDFETPLATGKAPLANKQRALIKQTYHTGIVISGEIICQNAQHPSPRTSPTGSRGYVTPFFVSEQVNRTFWMEGHDITKLRTCLQAKWLDRQSKYTWIKGEAWKESWSDGLVECLNNTYLVCWLLPWVKSPQKPMYSLQPQWPTNNWFHVLHFTSYLAVKSHCSCIPHQSTTLTLLWCWVEEKPRET